MLVSKKIYIYTQNFSLIYFCTFWSFQGFRVVEAVECWHKSLVPLMEEVRSQMGTGPVYLSFDIDSLDPAFAPGTGTPEIAGLTPIQVCFTCRSEMLKPAQELKATNEGLLIPFMSIILHTIQPIYRTSDWKVNTLLIWHTVLYITDQRYSQEQPLNFACGSLILTLGVA